MSLQIPHPSTPLHLYRHLLREATYLPPLCRPWVTDRIKTWYREPSKRHASDPKARIQKAHKDLRFLRAANAGHLERMLRICYMATGRVGKKRRELASTHLSVDAPEDTESLEATITGTRDGAAPLPAEAPAAKAGDSRRTKERENITVDRALAPTRTGFDWLDNWSTDKVQSLAASQSTRGPKLPYRLRKVIDPRAALPTENCWGQPFSYKLSRRKYGKHHISMLKNLLPPLPQGEWNALKALATGEADRALWAIPPRRPVGTPAQANSNVNTTSYEVVGSTEKTPAGSTGTDWDWTKYATRSVRSLEMGNSRSRKVLSGGVDENPLGQGHPRGVLTYKPRLLRRALYGRVWEASPVMKQKPSGKYDFEWGEIPRKVAQPGPKELSLFQGVDRKGVVVKAK